MDDIPNNFAEVSRYIEWLDRTYHEGPLISGPVFQRLTPDGKVLAHWLCYTFDAQTDTRRLWTLGGPVMAEIVEAYVAARKHPLGMLADFCKEPDTSGKLPSLVARGQRARLDEKLAVTPRYSFMLFSAAITLATLDRFGRSLAHYLACHRSFIEGEAGSIAERIAFLLYLLSYADASRKADVRPDSEHLRGEVDAHVARTLSTLNSPERFERKFESWANSSRRYHKRLWAALRDYLKEGREFQRYFLDALRAAQLGSLANTISREQEAIIAGLEVPGDVWNLRFLARIFGPHLQQGGKIGPELLRSWAEGSSAAGASKPRLAVVRFDVSFNYSPKMCEARREESCLFRKKSTIWELCPPRQGAEWKGLPCPVTDHLCGFEYPCAPENCPVRVAKPQDLCSGCRLTIEEARGANANS